MIEIPVVDAADQKMSLSLGGRRVTMRLRFNATTRRWSMDLSIDDQPVLHGRRIVTGVDLIAPFRLGVGLIFADTGGIPRLPGRTELPERLVRLYHATEAEVG